MKSRKKNAKEFHIRFLANNCRIVSDPIIQNYRNVNNDWAFSVRIKTYKHTHNMREREWDAIYYAMLFILYVQYICMHACKHTAYSTWIASKPTPICYGFNDTRMRANICDRTRFSTINSLSFRFLMVRENIPFHCSIVCIVI